MCTDNLMAAGTAIAVRQAYPEDLDAVIRLLNDLDYQIEGREAFERLWNRLLGDDRAWRVFVAVQDGEAVGFLTVNVRPALRLEGQVASIEELVVDHRVRGSGVGSALLDRAFSHADAEDCLRIEVLSSKRRESYRRAFYTKRGFLEHPSAVFRVNRGETEGFGTHLKEH